jgi:hypothetical protein
LPIVAAAVPSWACRSTLLGYRALETYGATGQVSALLGLGLYRELGPVLTALLFVGRAGSSIAAELGLMRATDQITALGLMAIDPVAKTVAPRFWAAVLTVPLLTGFFISLAIAAGYFEAVHVIGIDGGTFWQTMKDSVDFHDDFLVAFIKAAIFGGASALVGVLRRLPRRADHRRHVGRHHARGGQRLAAGADVQFRPFRPVVQELKTMRGPRLEFAVGAFLLLALASLLVLAIASTNNKWGFGGDTYPLKARFSTIGQLRVAAPVKIGGVVVGSVSDISLDPQRFDSIVTLSIDAATRTCRPIRPRASSPAACWARATWAWRRAGMSKP